MHQRAMVGCVLLVKPPIGGLGPARGRHHARRQRADIAGDGLPVRRGHEVEIGAGAQRPVFDVENQATQSAPSENIR